MKIQMFFDYEEDNSSQMSIEEFAEKYDLTMEVHDLGPDNIPRRGFRYYVIFSNAKIVQEGLWLVSKSGKGNSQEEAIADYTTQINNNILVLNAHDKERHTIKIPRLKQ